MALDSDCRAYTAERGVFGQESTNEASGSDGARNEAIRSQLEKAEADVAELLLARMVCQGEGYRFTGADLLRLRQLPPKVRAYFAKLTEPIVDEAACSRAQEVSEPDERGFRTVTYAPPYPKRCGCDAEVYLAHEIQWCRCVECLSAWPTRYEIDLGEHVVRSVRYPLVDGVSKVSIGRAIERLGL